MFHYIVTSICSIIHYDEGTSPRFETSIVIRIAPPQLTHLRIGSHLVEAPHTKLAAARPTR